MDFNQTFELKNGKRFYNYFKCIQYIQQHGRELYGNSYCIRPSQRQQLYRLLIYATANKEECALYGIDLQKGLLVTGPENSGKTSLLHLLKPFFQNQQKYLIRSCREVLYCYERFGNYTLQPYLSPGLHYCIDDLGMEAMIPVTISHVAVIQDLLQFRLINAPTNTHIISRMSTRELAENYGKDFTDLIYGNLNHIEFTRSFNF